ncbi:CAMK family protein kinase [Tritrichomonas foetus]|uniref:non-specific serine/threonine protein kinase n=1 Tax=Tritrichomonas foetus TaxID=1144522 RepID=A0A1J4L0G7_9EUKA|nr:CAMK family protein kinase [Tritrichomonas foetus]|eukprot:OHT16963.1 CAMK family protein kinase [Tritrichomonas foetus]
MLIGKYRLFRVIGEGSFSTVKLGYHIFTQNPVAVKIILKTAFQNPNDLQWLMQEVEVMRRLNHPGIVQLVDFIEDETAYYMVLEYCGGGELFDFIISRKRVEEPLAKKFFKQIVLTIAYIHSNNIVHRDLKPENLLLTETNSIKLIDFGLCSTTADRPLTNRCGSACYIAPEALVQSSYYGAPADIWALGVVLYTLVDGSIPWNYQDSNKMFEQITTGDFPMPRTLSAECQDLLRCILNPNPQHRITAESILTHPWLFGLGNVFPQPKPPKQALINQSNSNSNAGSPNMGGLNNQQPAIGQEPRLNLSLGGFSSNDLRQNIMLTTPTMNQNQNLHQNPPQPMMSNLETIYEDAPQPQPVQWTNPSIAAQNAARAPRQRPAQPRSISLDTQALAGNDGENDEDGTNTHRGVIISQTISHRDPNAVAIRFENVLIGSGVTYRRTQPLMFQLISNDLQVTAEVCRLYGFRNVYVISFKRISGDSWNYTQFVSAILNAMRT